MEIAAPRRGFPAFHPGEIVAEIVIPGLGVTRTAFAQALGVGRQTLYDLIDGRGNVTPQMALRLGKVCGNGADVWLALQGAFDLEKARGELGAQIDALPTLAEA